MSITPIEGDENAKSGGDDRPSRRSGVRARLRGVLDSLGNHVRSFLQRLRGSGSSSAGETTRDSRGSRLRVSGQRKLTSGKSSESAPRRGNLPGSTDLTAEREGDSLRVYNPELSDAYITSDTWQEIER